MNQSNSKRTARSCSAVCTGESGSTRAGGLGLTRRDALKLSLGVAGAVSFPAIWVPKPAFAQSCEARGAVKHLIYMRLAGGFRFTAGFNGDVAEEFNPFGLAASTAAGTEWGASRLLAEAPWLVGEEGAERAALGLRPVTELSDQIAVLATVDHEPGARNADGNHGSGLERYLTGYAGGQNSLFTRLHYGLRQQISQAEAQGGFQMPPFVLGASGMGRGSGALAGFRPAVVQGDSFDGFALAGADSLPPWAGRMAVAHDAAFQARLPPGATGPIEAYRAARESTKQFAEVFSSDLLRTRVRSEERVDGVTNSELATFLGDSRAARQLRLALRLFHFGCPAVYLDQGGYDMHSGEDERLGARMGELNRLISGCSLALKTMTHPHGGTYWDHTLLVIGSEFGRTGRGARFNSAGGSDHGGDFATRWMSMPVMGGLVSRLGIGGRQFGSTARQDLAPSGPVYSYRSVFKTLMDLLCADHSDVFPEERVLAEVFS